MNHGGHGDTEKNVRSEMIGIEGIEGMLFHLTERGEKERRMY